MNLTTTLQEYLTDVKEELSLDAVANNPEWTDTFIIRKIQDARHKFWNTAKYTQRRGMVTAATTIDIATVNIPATVDTISFIRFDDGTDRTPLTFIPWETFLHRTLTDNSGTPYEWSRQGGVIYLNPRPSATLAAGLQIYGRIGLTPLTTVAQVDGNIEARWKEMIVMYAVHKCWLKVENQSMANSYLNSFNKEFKDHEYEIVQDQTGQSIQIGAGEVWIDETDERRWGTLT